MSGFCQKTGVFYARRGLNKAGEKMLLLKFEMF